MTTATVNQMKCACSSCVCTVNVSDGMQKEGKYYCSDACASENCNGSGCCDHGCDCHP